MSDAYTNLYYHLVFSTKNRDSLLVEGLRQDLNAYIGGLIAHRDGKALIVNGMEDHLHILARLRQIQSIADVLRDVKGQSSGWIRKSAPHLRGFEWQRGYAAFSVSESQVPIVRDYIANQQEHHRHRSFEEEYVALLKANNLEFDERYLFR